MDTEGMGITPLYAGVCISEVKFIQSSVFFGPSKLFIKERCPQGEV